MTNEQPPGVGVRWEYRVVDGELDIHRSRFLELLNELGTEGWQAVSLTANPDRRGESDWHIALLKRAVRER